MASGTGQYSIPAFRSVRPSGHAAASPVKVIQAYRFALDPSPAQERSLRSHAGASRFAWNWGLARVQGAVRGRGQVVLRASTCTSCGMRPRR